jgi:glucose-6-phosphate isomerase/transaldolase/glucose-6-phosphate isomerase
MSTVRFSYSLGTYHSAVISALGSLSQSNIIARIWAKDYTVWKPAPDEITNRLGWLDAPAEMLPQIKHIRAILEPLISGGIKDAVLLGMGGSSLAAEVFSEIFGSHPGYPRLHVLDTTDPALIASTAQKLELKNTIFLVSSKSGTTLEITSLFQYFFNLVEKYLGNAAGSQFILITDQGSPMVKMAQELSLRHTFLNNPAIGGRYSALSMPGIVPAIIIGVDVARLLQNAVSAAQREKTQNFSDNLDDTGSALGATLGTLAQMGHDKLTLIMPPRFASFGSWLEQLIAESTGKEGKGILPVTGETISEPGAYGNDRIFVVFQNGREDNSPKIASLVANGHPVITIENNDIYELGAQMFIWEMATAVAVHILKINPFDQPDVEAAKKYAHRMIASYRENKGLHQEAPALTTPECAVFGRIKASSASEALKNFLKQARALDYVCLQVYLSPTLKVDEALRKLRKTIFIKYGLAVTIGYGPRYLHSTGQLHKGDSGNGLFIQLTADDLIDVNIPESFGAENSTLTFGKLKAAQAQGDWQALIDAGRRVIRFHLRTNPAAGLKKLVELL